MKHYGSLVMDSLESMCNEYVSTILHMALHIAEDDTSKEFSMRLEFEIIGEESSSRVDYAIKVCDFFLDIFEDKLIPYLSSRNQRTLFVSLRIRSSVIFSKVMPKI